MNVLVVNQQESTLAQLNIEVIKTMRGVFTTDELIGTFTNFFFVRMIIDVTALQNYEDAVTYQKLSIGLPIDKVILLIPPTSQLTNNLFLSKLISMGYYNFTTNLDGVRYLLQTPNTYRDVAHLHQIESQAPTIVIENKQGAGQNYVVGPMVRTLGVKNVTEGAGSSSLIYMMKRVLEERYKKTCLGIEVGKKDFMYFRDKNMVSTDKSTIATELLKSKNFDFVLVDLNDYPDNICDDVIYLVEPSVLKLNKLMMRDRTIFSKLKDKKVIINRSTLSEADIKEFATEAGINIFYVLPPLNDRERSPIIADLLRHLGLVK